jgi:transposase
MATGFVMVLCLLVYRLAEHWLRQRLAETGTTVPDQLNKPTRATHPPLGVSMFRGHQLHPDPK